MPGHDRIVFSEVLNTKEAQQTLKKKTKTKNDWECDCKSQTKSVLNTGKSWWNDKPRNTAVDFSGSVLLCFRAEDCTAAADEARVGCRHRKGLAGIAWAARSLEERLVWLHYTEYTETGPKMSAQTGGGKEEAAHPFLFLWQSQSAATEACFPVQAKGPHGQPSAFLLEMPDSYHVGVFWLCPCIF